MNEYEKNMKDEIRRIIQESNESDFGRSNQTKEGALMEENIDALYEGYQELKSNKEESEMFTGIEDYVYTLLGL